MQKVKVTYLENCLHLIMMAQSVKYNIITIKNFFNVAMHAKDCYEQV